MTEIARRTFLSRVGAASLAACTRDSRATPRRTVVIGGGLAGLATAHALVKCDFDVVVLEAQGRVGGRIRTIRELGDGLVVEAGATHVVGDPDMLALTRELGVSLHRIQHPERARVRFRDGSRSVTPAGAPAPRAYALSPDEEALGPEALHARTFALASSIDPRAVTWPDAIARLDRLTAADWLRASGASPGFIAQTNDSFAAGDGIEAISALSLLRDVASFEREARAGGGGRVVGGTDRIPEALAARLGERVRRRSQVRAIAQHRDSVDVVFSDETGTHRMTADRVVCAIPLTVLRRIDVTPAWSAAKARAIAELAMTSVTRIHLGTSRRFWAERGESGTAETDLRIGAVRDETDAQPGTQGVLGVYLSGAPARRFGAIDPAARIAAAVDDVERVHPGMKEHFRHGVATAWDEEPFARGAYAWFAPGQLTALARASMAPEGRVHFAGDGVSYRPGFMHGALASAKRVVAEITGPRA